MKRNVNPILPSNPKPPSHRYDLCLDCKANWKKTHARRCKACYDKRKCKPVQLELVQKKEQYKGLPLDVGRDGKKSYEVDANGCWIWKRWIASNGYPRTYVNRKPMMAHRAMYIRYRGSIPKGLQLDHRCRMKACVNPWHLEPVTQSENVRRTIPFRKRACYSLKQTLDPWPLVHSLLLYIEFLEKRMKCVSNQ